MKQHLLTKRTPLVFKHFSRKGYALFSVLGKEVLIGVLSVPTLSYAKATGMSTKLYLSEDTVPQKEMSLDEVTIMGARAPLTALQSARIVEVISKDDIHRAAVESIHDLLKLATGVDVRQRGGFGVQTDISINGGTFDQITILLNGIPMNNPQTGHNAADFPVALSDIERVEVLEGGSARVFGSAAFSGAINIVTRSGEPSNVVAGAEAGSFGSIGANAGVTLSGKSLSNHASLSYMRSDGGTKNSDFDMGQLYYQGRLNVTHLKMDWQFGMGTKDYGANTFYSARFDNQWEKTTHYIASVKADVGQLPMNIHLTPTLYWNRYRDHYQLTKGQEGASAGENYHIMDVYGASMNASIDWMAGTTCIGADIRKEHILSTAYGEVMDQSDWKDIHGSSRQYDKKAERTNTSLFIEHDFLWKGLTVSAGVLANKNTGLDHDFHFYPGVDASYRIGSHWKTFLSWNRALRMPTYTDLYTSNQAQQGDLNLQPERNTTYKAGATWRAKGMQATVSAFYSKGTNMIDWVYETQESTRYHAMNIGKLNNMGASAEWRINFAALMNKPVITSFRIGYAYIHQNHKTSEPIYKSLYALEYLRHKLTMNLRHRIWKELSADWSIRWQQRMNGYNPYWKIDTKVMWEKPKYDLFVKIDNLTCHRYYDFGAVRQPGIWVMAGGTIRLNL